MKKIINYFNGKKTIIGLSLHAGWFLANLIFKDIATDNEALTGHAMIFSITGVGLGHKAVKQVNKSIENAKNINKNL